MRCSRMVALVVIASINSGCAGLLPTPVPQPTRLEPAGDTEVEVAVDNRSANPMALTVSQNRQMRGGLTVGMCEATNIIVALDGPFVVGLGPAADFADAPMPLLVQSSEIPADAQRRYRVLVSVDAEGEVRVGPLEGVAPIRGPGEC
ncbi:MAG: hypothetical protein QOF68_50 [Gaiellales bacterium]|nr:hypothetical protein [Gaiellales bacterium]